MSYHEEQETLDNLKAWWAQWGNAITWAVLVVLVALAAWSGWNYWQRRETAGAAVLYDQLQQAVAVPGPDAKAHIARIAGDMENTFGRTPYASMGALSAAAALYRAGDPGAAKAQLQWVVEHGSEDDFRQLARIRLAGLLLDEKAYDAGLTLLAGTPPSAFAGLWSDRRGDLLAAAGKLDDARSAYRSALAAPGADPSTQQLVQFKLDALGG